MTPRAVNPVEERKFHVRLYPKLDLMVATIPGVVVVVVVAHVMVVLALVLFEPEACHVAWVDVFTALEEHIYCRRTSTSFSSIVRIYNELGKKQRRSAAETVFHTVNVI